jgi:hypothetical protein
MRSKASRSVATVSGIVVRSPQGPGTGYRVNYHRSPIVGGSIAGRPVRLRDHPCLISRVRRPLPTVLSFRLVRGGH